MLKPCPNPECQSTHVEATVPSYNAFGDVQVLCWDCLMRGPAATTKERAEHLWDLLPRIAPVQSLPEHISTATQVQYPPESEWTVTP